MFLSLSSAILNNNNDVVLYKDVVRAVTPQASHYKESVIEWIALWPLSVLNAIVLDLLQQVFNLVFKSIRNVFQSISDKTFGSF